MNSDPRIRQAVRSRASSELNPFIQALEKATQDILGSSMFSKVQVLAERELRGAHVAKANAALLWLTANMPVTAERILRKARKSIGSNAG